MAWLNLESIGYGSGSVVERCHFLWHRIACLNVDSALSVTQTRVCVLEHRPGKSVSDRLIGSSAKIPASTLASPYGEVRQRRGTTWEIQAFVHPFTLFQSF